MKFYTRSVPTQAGNYKEILLLGEQHQVLCHLRAKEDTISAWEAGLLKLIDGDQAEQLVVQARDLSDCEIQDAATQATFLRFMHALYAALQATSLPGRQEALAAVRLFLDYRFNFRAEYQGNAYHYGLIVNGKKQVGERTPLGRSDAHPLSVPKSVWTHFLISIHQSEDNLTDMIVDHAFLREAALRQDQPFILKSFAEFLKALIELLEQDQSYILLRPFIPELCTFIVQNEHDSVDEQKHYLQRILESQEALHLKTARVQSIIWDVRQDTEREGQPDASRLATLISLVSDHYLSTYDLEQVVASWNLLKGKDWLLRRLLSLYRSPGRYVGVMGVYFLILTCLACLNRTKQHMAVVWSTWALLMPVYVGITCLLLWLGYRLLWKKDLYYSQLFLPRLFGANVVGLSFLLVDDTPWRIALKSQVPTLLLIGLATYTMAFVYIFIDVHRTVRLLRSLPGQERGSIEHAVEISRKIFAIGWIEALFAILITATLFFPLIDLSYTRDAMGGVIAPPNWHLPFAFFPALTFLWTGLTLFIGAFVQLLWQDRRITEPV